MVKLTSRRYRQKGVTEAADCPHQIGDSETWDRALTDEAVKETFVANLSEGFCPECEVKLERKTTFSTYEQRRLEVGECPCCRYSWRIFRRDLERP